MYVFVYHNENIRSSREKSWSVDVNWEGDIGDSLGPLASFFYIYHLFAHYNIPVSIPPYFIGEDLRLREMISVALGYSDGN